MRKLIYALTAVVAAALGGCSGGDETLFGGGGPAGQADVASLTLLTSSPQLPSDGTANATITALVRDENNNVMENVAVLMTASSGSLAVASPGTTDANGVLTATLSTPGDPTNRAITVNATAGNAQASVTVNVVGTSLVLSGPTSLPLGEVTEYTVVLSNAGGTGIPNVPVAIASSTGNGISATPVTTDALGRAEFDLTANVGGIDNLTADALGIQTVLAVDVSSDVFAFTAPAPATEIPLNTDQSITVHWEIAGVDQNAAPVQFSTTRGAFNPANGAATTDASGNATITVSATNAGPAVITATNSAGTSTQLNLIFVATTADAIELQADPFTVPTEGQSAITAIVRDPQGNLVKNKVVVFTLDDVTGGELSVAQATTDGQGRARTFYNASQTTSASDGVTVTATVQDTPAVTDSASLTVAQREVFISLGTGNEISEPNTAQYNQEWVVIVTDAQGGGVSAANVSLSILSERYWEGVRAFVDPPGTWVTRPGIEALPLAGCPDEDLNRNGAVDAGEDLNNNGRIEAGNKAFVTPQVTMNEDGFGLIDVSYPQDHAYWLEVTLEARTTVQGTEFSEQRVFLLEGVTTDFNQEDSSPPGLVSPFGTDGNCATPPPPDGP